jgi:phosphomannomutase/phosphoglucomutase
MSLLPKVGVKPNSYDYETNAVVAPTGFREYDARWLFGDDLNYLGVQALGLGLGTYIHEVGVKPRIVVGHDFRSYSINIKNALMLGLQQAGCEVLDIGLALSPIAYFGQFDLDAPCVAMVTASHNENGWTGVKMGTHAPLTFGPEGRRASRRHDQDGRRRPEALRRRDRLQGQDQASAQGHLRLRQRHGGRVCPASAARHGRRSHRDGLRPRQHLP